MDYCVCRRVGISPEEISVQCSVCQSIHKPECANLSYSEAYTVSNKIGVFWSCRNCLSISNDISILKRENLLLHAELKDALRSISEKKPHKDGDGYQAKNGQVGNLGFLEEATGTAELINQFNVYDPVQPSTSRQRPSTHNRLPTSEFERNPKFIDANSLADFLTETYTDSLTSKNQTSQGEEWECIFCTFLNTSEALICSACSNPHPISTETTKTTVPEIKPLHFNLLNLNDEDLVSNTETFECAICFAEVKPREGAVLKNCLHQFCKQCLAEAVEHSNDAEIKCPYRNDHYSCDSPLQDREIMALVKSEIYEQHVARSIAEAEVKIQNTFHCKTPNCKGWCIYEDDDNTFQCPICTKENCMTCEVIHERMNCKQYQDAIQKKTKETIKELIESGRAMNCPGCKVVIIKNGGCDHMLCTACRRNFVWTPKGLRRML